MNNKWITVSLNGVNRGVEVNDDPEHEFGLSVFRTPGLEITFRIGLWFSVIDVIWWTQS